MVTDGGGRKETLQQIAAQLLAGMLANPHLYTSISDDMGRGPQERDLVVTAVQLAEALIARIDESA
jgi:hypothetical protein